MEAAQVTPVVPEATAKEEEAPAAMVPETTVKEEEAPAAMVLETTVKEEEAPAAMVREVLRQQLQEQAMAISDLHLEAPHRHLRQYRATARTPVAILEVMLVLAAVQSAKAK